MFFPNMREVIRSVPKEKQLELREAIENYVFDGIESDDWAIRAIIQSMKPVLDYRSVGAPKGNNNNPHGRKGKTKEPIEEIDLTNNQLNQSEPIKPIDNQLNQLKTIKSNKQEKEKEREKEQEVKKINLTVYTKEKLEIDNDFIAEPFKEPFIRWLKYKKARKELYANADSLMTCYNKLLKESNNDPLIADAMIEAAIGNNYQGFFPLRNTPTKTQGEVKEWLKY